MGPASATRAGLPLSLRGTGHIALDAPGRPGPNDSHVTRRDLGERQVSQELYPVSLRGGATRCILWEVRTARNNCFGGALPAVSTAISDEIGRQMAAYLTGLGSSAEKQPSADRSAKLPTPQMAAGNWIALEPAVRLLCVRDHAVADRPRRHACKLSRRLRRTTERDLMHSVVEESSIKPRKWLYLSARTEARRHRRRGAEEYT